MEKVQFSKYLIAEVLLYLDYKSIIIILPSLNEKTRAISNEIFNKYNIHIYEILIETRLLKDDSDLNLLEQYKLKLKYLLKYVKCLKI
jgi:hypothetical protein